MNSITLYDQPDFNGKCMDFVGNIPDLSAMFLANVARSVKVVGQHWAIYREVNFKGQFSVLGHGDHKSLGQLDRQISSLRLVKEDLRNPEIDLFEHINYLLPDRNVQQKVDDLRRIGFTDLVSSHKVTRGVWILHQGFNQNGPRLITFKDDQWPDYTSHGWDDKLSSLRPLLSSDKHV